MEKYSKTILNVDTLRITLRKKNYKVSNEGENDLFKMDGNNEFDFFALNWSNTEHVFQRGRFTFIRDKVLPDKHYNLSCQVWFNNRQLGILFLDKRLSNDMTGTQHVLFKFSNSVLYSDFITPFNELMEIGNMEINNFTQIDIALNTHFNLLQEFLKFYGKEEKYHFISNGKSKDEVLAVINREFKVTGGVYFGSRGRKFIRIYNKSKEITENTDCDKSYINNWFSTNGLDSTIPVYRFELGLKAAAFRQYNYGNSNATNNSNISATSTKQVLDLNSLRDQEYLFSLLKHNLKRLFQFRHKTSTRINRCKPIDFFSFVNISDGSSIKVIEVPVEKREALAVKALIKKQYLLYLKTGVDNYYSAAEHCLLANEDLKPWFSEEKKKWGEIKKPAKKKNNDEGLWAA